jgi:hypothetical protein
VSGFSGSGVIVGGGLGRGWGLVRWVWALLPGSGGPGVCTVSWVRAVEPGVSEGCDAACTGSRLVWELGSGPAWCIGSVAVSFDCVRLSFLVLLISSSRGQVLDGTCAEMVLFFLRSVVNSWVFWETSVGVLWGWFSFIFPPLVCVVRGGCCLFDVFHAIDSRLCVASLWFIEIR